jgi:hypothetical protein
MTLSRWRRLPVVVLEGSAKFDPQAAVEPSPNVGRTEMPRELPVDLSGPPIRRLPGLESVPKFLALLPLHMKKGAVAAGVDSHIAVAIKLKPMCAGEMMQPTPVQFEVSRSVSQGTDYRINVEETYDEFFHDDLL